MSVSAVIFLVFLLRFVDRAASGLRAEWVAALVGIRTANPKRWRTTALQDASATCYTPFTSRLEHRRTFLRYSPGTNQLALAAALLLGAVCAPAQSNPPIRLALVSTTGDATAAADVLTARLTADASLQLLERDEIERVYREQALSAATRDYVKLGRVLGADGLLLLEVVRFPQETNLLARLIAVKPGVVLTEGSFAWPLQDPRPWADAVAVYVHSFSPKLRVLAKDAIPISVVNLRSAVQSPEAEEAERQLKLLAIQRLSQERQFFVSERQRMQLLSEEKDLKQDESPFWSGSYLLEGVVDQNGYSPEQVTIDGRLTPPRGGAPLLFEVSGSRTNFAAVINRLAGRVAELLKISSTVPEWNAADEAAQFFEEAKWALRWDVPAEAQAAAESAWALGKRDVDSAVVRIRAYVSEVPKLQAPNVTRYVHGRIAPHYVHLDEPPDPRYLDLATYALRCYYNFSRTSADGEPKVLWKETGQNRALGWHDWHNSGWYQLGIEDLEAASRVLQHFYFVPASQKPVADKLAELRALARDVAELICRSPSVRDTYFVGDRLAAYDELCYTIGGERSINSNIYGCKLAWGFLWEETPEAGVALYRELLASPVFCYLHRRFWFPPEEDNLPTFRLAAWREEDRSRVPEVWQDFMQELSGSTNVLWRLEGQALQLATVTNELAMARGFTNFFDTIFANHDYFVTNNVDLLYLNWGAGDLVRGMGGKAASHTKDILQQAYYSDYSPRLDAMRREYRDKTVPALEFQSAFEEQKRFFKENKPYDFFAFAQLFSFLHYSRAQALEIQPLLAAYKSNLVAQAQRSTGIERGRLQGAIAQVGFREDVVRRILTSPEKSPAPAFVQQTPQAPPTPAGPMTPQTAVTSAGTPEDMATNVLPVGRFLKIPRERIQGNRVSGFQLAGFRWSEGRLIAALGYDDEIYDYDARGKWRSTRYAKRTTFALFNSRNETWDLIDFPEGSGPELFLWALQDSSQQMILFQDKLLILQGSQLETFNLRTHQWSATSVPDLEATQLFAVEGRLFASGRNAIIEILANRSTRILAGTRRRPAVSTLDVLDDFGSPTLFSGPDHSVCASIGDRIFSWTGNDWHEVLTLKSSQPPEIFEDAILFRYLSPYGSGDPATLWIWTKDRSQPELCLLDKSKPQPGVVNLAPRRAKPAEQKPFWHSLDQEYLTGCAATYFKSNLYFLVDHTALTNVAGRWVAEERNGYHAKLVCLRRDLAEPIVIPLKFDITRGQPPLQNLSGKTQPWLRMNPSASFPRMYFTETALFIAQPNTPGIWVIPVSELEPALAAQKRFLIANHTQSFAATVLAREKLLAKYDRNHNGVIDPEEREAALDDPKFLAAELDRIDTNHNGWLDPEELIYFDANRNRILDAREEAGIQTAQRLLAQKLMQTFDLNGDGQLSLEEFAAVPAEAVTPGGPPALLVFNRCDHNHDQKLDRAEVEQVLQQRTFHGLQAAIFRMRPRPDFSPRPNSPMTFKEAVEKYWARMLQSTNHPVQVGGSAAPPSPHRGVTP